MRLSRTVEILSISHGVALSAVMNGLLRCTCAVDPMWGLSYVACPSCRQVESLWASQLEPFSSA